MDFDKRFRVPTRGFHLADRDPADHAGLTKAQGRKRHAADIERLAESQGRFYAEGEHALLMVLQGLDASGKDGTIASTRSCSRTRRSSPLAPRIRRSGRSASTRSPRGIAISRRRARGC